MEKRTDWYEHPEYYEAIFGTDTVREADFLQALSARHGTGGSQWLEPACGAGRLVAEAASRGMKVAGYDISEAMLAHARKRLTPAERRRVKLAPSRMEEFFEPALEGKVDVAHNLVSTFRYLDSEAAALAHLKGTRRLLKPNGIYVLGFHLTDYSRSVPEHERWLGRVGKDKVVCNTHEGLPDRRARRSPMRNRLRITGPGKDWLIETTWFFRTYDAAQAGKLFRDAGLSVVAAYDFDYDVSSPVARGSRRLDRVFVLRPDAGSVEQGASENAPARKVVAAAKKPVPKVTPEKKVAVPRKTSPARKVAAAAKKPAAKVTPEKKVAAPRKTSPARKVAATKKVATAPDATTPTKKLATAPDATPPTKKLATAPDATPPTKKPTRRRS
ncbi:methyltransferase domain-containing protein [Myxococcus sp. CA039A]|uniref:class I SAM-dependent methyltransferase n=1 Tax=Myxococcus sp. CA039A TaxID=2741737 RepID=UPI00359C75EB